MRALAYLNYGQWVADCPEPGCSDARAVYVGGQRHTEDVCKKGHFFEIEMPPVAEEARIVAAVADREDRDKAWFPRGHGWATTGGFPTGQTAAELQAEGREVARRRAEQRAVKREQIAAVLAEHGLTLQPDGTVSGRI